MTAYNEANIARFAELVQPTFDVAKYAAVRQASGYYALTSGVQPVGITAVSVPVTADPREPFISTWQALASGRPYEEAVDAGTLRIEAVVTDLVSSSAMQTGDVFAEKANLRVVAWERIPDDTACPWCEEVSPGPILESGLAGYYSAESADAVRHNNCGCTADPIFADEVNA